MRLCDFFDKSADLQPGAAAVLHAGQVWTYQHIQVLSHRVAAALMGAGLEPGAKVATWMPNHPLFFVMQIGIHRTPFVWLPVNPRSTETEAAGLMHAFGATWLIADGSMVGDAAALREAVPSLQGVVVLDRDFDTWIAPHQGSAADVHVAPSDVVTLLTTGGSTGAPKGVMRMSMNWAALVANYRVALRYEAPPVNLAVTPLTHVAGEVALAAFAEGGSTVILDTADPASILDAIEWHRVTTLFLPPTLIYSLLIHPGVRERDFSSLQYLMYGSAPISVEKLRQAWDVFGPVMTHVYGLMEATSTVSIMLPAEHAEAFAKDPARLGSCGRGSPFVAIDVRGPGGESLPAGQRGEVVCRGQNLLLGYEGNPQATAEALRGGWFHTGDVGVRDPSGYLHLVDRTKDIIISGGFNIYPGEVEQVIWTHPSVRDCAVIGVPDEKWGEAVTAVIELKPGMTLDAASIIQLCRNRLGSIRAPKQVVVWAELPRSNVGKVLKKDIRSMYWAKSARAI